MSLNGSYTATLSPGATSDAFRPSLLSASISSISSSVSARHTSHISKTYKQASTLFLTRRLPEALSTILPIITPPHQESDALIEPAPVARASRTTRIKVWSLYLTILNAIVELEPDEGKDAFGSQEWRNLCSKVREGDVWEEVVRNGYHGVEGDVDSDVVINLATLLLAHARTQGLNQKRLETYLAASTSPNLDLSRRFTDASPTSPRAPSRHRSPAKGTSGADTPRDLNARVKILELYTLHVLLRNNEWDYAREFISVSSVLDEERRDAFLQALQSLQEEQAEAERRELEERREQEEQLRRDIAEAKRLRAENEERERKRLEEEWARRAGSEVDYGIEKTPSVSGSAQGRHGRTSSGQSGSARPATSRTSVARPKGKSAAVPTLGDRASMVMTRLKALIDQLGNSFQANPVFMMRLVAFILGLVLMFGQKNIRERIQRVMGSGWNKVKATAGMGVKVSYI